MEKCLKTVIITVVFMLIPCFCYADTGELINDFINDLPEQIDIDNQDQIDDLINIEEIFRFIIKTASSFASECGELLLGLVCLVLLFSLLDSLGIKNDKLLSDIANPVVSICVLSMGFTILMSQYNIIQSSIESMKVFSSSSVVVITALCISSGQSFSSAVFSSVLSFGISIFEMIADNFLLPLILIFTSFGVICNITDKFNLIAVNDYIKKFIKWSISFLIGIFTLSISFQSFLAKASDNIAKKTIKTAVGSFIPIVGSSLSGSIDSLFALANGTKTSIAIIGALSIVVVFLPSVIGCICYAAVFVISKVIATFFNLTSIIKIFSALSDAFFILAAVCSFGIFMVIAAYLLICINII